MNGFKFRQLSGAFQSMDDTPQHRALGRALAIAPDLHFVAHAVDLRSLMNLWEIYGKSMGNLWGLGDWVILDSWGGGFHQG